MSQLDHKSIQGIPRSHISPKKIKKADISYLELPGTPPSSECDELMTRYEKSHSHPVQNVHRESVALLTTLSFPAVMSVSPYASWKRLIRYQDAPRIAIFFSDLLRNSSCGAYFGGTLLCLTRCQNKVYTPPAVLLPLEPTASL